MRLGPWEIALFLGLAIILVFGLRLARLNPPTGEPRHGFLFWVAQGFGVGRIPFAPGTFGSAVGLLWLIVSLGCTGNWFSFLLCQVVAVGFCVRACGVAEQVLGQKDPSSVVLDEIVAVPLCFVGWIAVVAARAGSLPHPEYFFTGPTGLFTAGVFVLFRLFDIAKPWPIRASQGLPGGWGITIDDLLAAVYVNGVVLAILLVKSRF